jgi:TP901-1 family phage major tail protein
VAKQLGRAVLVQVELPAGSGTFVSLGGTRTKSVKINNEIVDVTDADSEGARQLLEGAGVNSIQLTASGLFADDEAVDAVREAAEENLHRKFKVIFPGASYSRVYEGEFAASSFEEGGEYNSAVTFSVTLDSAGEITKTRLDD